MGNIINVNFFSKKREPTVPVRYLCNLKYTEEAKAAVEFAALSSRRDIRLNNFPIPAGEYPYINVSLDRLKADGYGSISVHDGVVDCSGFWQAFEWYMRHHAY